MYWLDYQKHKMPHFHARYRGLEAVFNLEGACLVGNLGLTAHKLIAEWSAENRSAINLAWNCAVEGKEIPWIKPLQ